VAGSLWKDHDQVFASIVGTPLDDHNVRRQFRVITEAAGLGKAWVPRELRHTFVRCFTGIRLSQRSLGEPKLWIRFSVG
jgi:site-specific recombinase XerC